MDWRVKCAAFQALRWVPGRRHVHAMLQRFVTRTYLPALDDNLLSLYSLHAERMRLAGKTRRALEFGAGSNLACALLLSAAGAEEVYAYDLERLATTEQTNFMIRQLREKVPGVWPELQHLDELERLYRIRYRAPGDVRRTGLPLGSIDFVCSTNTLEHIPPAQIDAIIRECIAVSAPGAIFSHLIDYADHYSFADPSITAFNFYRYSTRQWRWLNPSAHYQNRLRHSDFERKFRLHRLVPIETRRWKRESLESVPLAREFRSYDVDDLLTSSGYFALERSR